MIKRLTCLPVLILAAAFSPFYGCKDSPQLVSEETGGRQEAGIQPQAKALPQPEPESKLAWGFSSPPVNVSEKALNMRNTASLIDTTRLIGGGATATPAAPTSAAKGGYSCPKMRVAGILLSVTDQAGTLLNDVEATLELPLLNGKYTRTLRSHGTGNDLVMAGAHGLSGDFSLTIRKAGYMTEKGTVSVKNNNGCGQYNTVSLTVKLKPEAPK